MQAQSFTQNWKKLPNDYPWFLGNGNDVNSLAYNPITDKLLVSRRGSKIYVINPATGASSETDTLKTNSAVMGTEGFKFSKIRIDGNGVIYAISLQTAAGTARIYRWASQTDTATLAASFPVTERTGDAFGLSGTGANTVLYASGAGTVNNAFSIYILNTTNGSNFTLESTVKMNSVPIANQAWANRAVEPEGTGVTSPLWIKGGGFEARKITIGNKDVNNIRSATLVAEIPNGTGSGQASVGYGGMRLFTTANNTKFLCFAGGNNSYAGTKMTALTVASNTDFQLFGRDSLVSQDNYNTNGNGTGDVTFKANANGTFTVFYIATNNGIASATSRSFVATNDLKTPNFTVKTLGNPIHEALNLQVNVPNARKATVSVYNTVGSLLDVQKMNLTEGDNLLHLSAAKLPSGLLFVEIYDGEAKQIIKVVKQ